MTEPELQNLLKRALLRTRFECALRWALTALVAGCVASALSVFAMRWTGVHSLPLSLAISLPIVFAVVSGAAGFFLTRATPATVAASLDRNAKTQEHLLTWLYLRESTDTDLIRTSFKQAQQASALRAADQIQLRRDAPVQLPRWSRAFWLASILLISAILTPPADTTIHDARDRSNRTGESSGAGADSVAAGSDGLANSVRDIAKVQVLSPAQLRKLELIATDERLPKSLQADALKELQNAIGGISENELAPEVRQLLDMLRKNAGKSKEQSTVSNPGVTDATEKPSRALVEPAAEYKAFEDVEKGWSTSEPRFADVKEALKRYYKSAGK